MADKRNTKFTKQRRTKYLEYFRETGNVSASARAAGVTRATIYNHLNQNPDFAQAHQDALDEHLDELEQSLIARGKSGQSDTAAIFMLKSMRREQYGDRGTIEHTGNVHHDHEHRAVQETNNFIESVLAEGEDRPLPKSRTH